MTTPGPLVLLGASLTFLVSEAALTYASTALGDVAISFKKWLLTSATAAIVWAVVAGGAAVFVTHHPHANTLLRLGALVGGLVLAVVAPALLSAPVLTTTRRRALLIAAYHLALRTLLYAVAAATAFALLRLLLAA